MILKNIQLYKKQFVLFTDTHEEVGRIADVSNFFFLNTISYSNPEAMICGFLKNDLELLVYKNEFDGKDYYLWLKLCVSELYKHWKSATYDNR